MFGRRLKNLYGERYITPNMHMQCHLCDCVRDYGPLHSFWLFSFERYNGLLGKQPTNNRAIECQLMNRFLKDNAHLELLYKSESMPLQDVFGLVVSEYTQAKSTTIPTDNGKFTFSEPTKYTLRILSTENIDILKKIYSKLIFQH